MVLLIALQIALPLALILWLALRPPPSWTAIALHALAIALIVTALRLAGFWTLLPWWLTIFYAVGGVAALLIAVRDKPRRAAPRGREYAALALLALAAAIGGAMTYFALAGRQPAPAPSVELAWPFGAGQYLVVNGGGNAAVNPHVGTLDDSVPRRRLWRGQSYALDIVRLNAAGRTASELQPADPARYMIFGTPILAPCGGRVMAAGNDSPDIKVPFAPTVPDTGNHVLLRCGAADVLLAHMRRGSVRVRAGDRVRPGQQLGEAGNSGSTSEPHLHIHAQRPGRAGAPFSGDPLVIRFGGHAPVRNDRVSF